MPTSKFELRRRRGSWRRVSGLTESSSNVFVVTDVSVRSACFVHIVCVLHAHAVPVRPHRAGFG